MDATTPPLHILYIEDCLDDIYLLRGQLELAGLSIDLHTASTWPELIVELRDTHRPWDCIIVDVRVPGMEFEQVMSSVLAVPDVPVVVFSGTFPLYENLLNRLGTRRVSFRAKSAPGQLIDWLRTLR